MAIPAPISTQTSVCRSANAVNTGRRNLTTTFVQRLRELGWIEGRSITIDRWRPRAFRRDRRRVRRLKVNVIVTHSAEPVLAAKQVTSVIPIVFGAAADPVGSGLVTSRARPGANVTGQSVQFTDLAGKRLDRRLPANDAKRLYAIVCIYDQVMPHFVRDWGATA